MSNNSLQPLIDIMAALRDPNNGCPWDLKQTYKTIVPYTIEEAYEVADAIETEDFDELQGELGDLLFQVVFYCQLAKEEGRFEFNDVLETVCEKLTRRHPHVFSDVALDDEAAVKANWEAEKKKERDKKATEQVSYTLSHVPKTLPALTRANKLQKRCANVGFDWPTYHGALDKVEEEIIEIKQELACSAIDPVKVGEEVGDLMFAVVNLARKLKLDPEATLRAANKKFETRFNRVESKALDNGHELNDLTLAEMESLWLQVKQEK
ncbi:nucleoside triphosphate pyrophosphohydrolase [Saccharobesus litoralis]|uniref:Nucleoside triphosphate pyrophosphohydrolase n=1 Tax=Saccharobesus litoralis TaxID=2172099 RepID=A0A2S0VTP8_9ALTE|nr:nucleoside triphosphate pyrophosphohydrolase [Saccharobesus litoralis]AWB67585.1 nucleoside triphosphate pyrophosphohydrolase [Saccharobesus litoralis]